jgi:ABC-type uncharacterized transport system permease subunit
VVACLGVAFAESVNIAFQITNVGVSPELVTLLPYVTTLAVLIVVGGRKRQPPRSLGRV